MLVAACEQADTTAADADPDGVTTPAETMEDEPEDGPSDVLEDDPADLPDHDPAGALEDDGSDGADPATSDTADMDADAATRLSSGSRSPACRHRG